MWGGMGRLKPGSDQGTRLLLWTEKAWNDSQAVMGFGPSGKLRFADPALTSLTSPLAGCTGWKYVEDNDGSLIRIPFVKP